MLNIGDEVDGWCPRCKRNTFMNVAAVDEKEVLTSTCRTCHNTNNFQPERSREDQKADAWRKLDKLRKRTVVGRKAPDVVTKPRRGETLESVPEPEPQATDAFNGAAADESRDRWRTITRDLGPRDGKPYYADRPYTEGDVVLHKRHGMGIVETILHENACMVLFRDGGKVIEMNQPTAY